MKLIVPPWFTLAAEAYPSICRLLAICVLGGFVLHAGMDRPPAHAVGSGICQASVPGFAFSS